MIQISSKKPLRGLISLWWSPKEKAEVSYFWIHFDILLVAVGFGVLQTMRSFPFRKQYLRWWCEDKPSKIAERRKRRGCCLHPNAKNFSYGFAHIFGAWGHLPQRSCHIRTWSIWCLLEVCNPCIKICHYMVFFLLKYLYILFFKKKRGGEFELTNTPPNIISFTFMLEVFGMCRNKEKVIINEQCGYLMRTKVSSSNEGGVAAGFAVLDSIYLN